MSEPEPIDAKERVENLSAAFDGSKHALILTHDNPGLVVASITGFGLSGPYSEFKAPPIVCSAMGGVMALCGSPDREPLSEPGDVPYDLAASFAAYGVMLALRQRDLTGRGQRVEVSCQEVLAAQQHIVDLCRIEPPGPLDSLTDHTGSEIIGAHRAQGPLASLAHRRSGSADNNRVLHHAASFRPDFNSSMAFRS